MKHICLIIFLIVFSKSLSLAQLNRYSTLPKATIQNTQVLPDLNLINQAQERQQREYERQQRQYEINVQKEEMAVANCKQQATDYYNSLNSYKNVPDGWYQPYALSTDNSLCATRKVEVKNNKVISYLRGDGVPLKVVSSFPINNAKTMVEIIYEEGDRGNIILYFF